jgi:hypothetical protein
MIRYYLHGDQHEGGGDVWYCARCDSFVAQEHFYRDRRHTGLEGDKDYPRYLDGVKRLKIVMDNGRGRYLRPPSPRNCIA